MNVAGKNSFTIDDIINNQRPIDSKYIKSIDDENEEEFLKWFDSIDETDEDIVEDDFLNPEEKNILELFNQQASNKEPLYYEEELSEVNKNLMEYKELILNASEKNNTIGLIKPILSVIDFDKLSRMIEKEEF